MVQGPAFESYRGAIVDEDGRVVFFATPAGGGIGVYSLDGSGSASGVRHVLALGDDVLGSTVVDLALNPVSIARGFLAIRVALADDRQAIVRWPT